MLIERDLTIQRIAPDSLDVQPRGDACFGLSEPDHRFCNPVYAAGFKYQICAACGTVRISECFANDAAEKSEER